MFCKSQIDTILKFNKTKANKKKYMIAKLAIIGQCVLDQLFLLVSSSVLVILHRHSAFIRSYIYLPCWNWCCHK